MVQIPILEYPIRRGVVGTRYMDVRGTFPDTGDVQQTIAINLSTPFYCMKA